MSEQQATDQRGWVSEVAWTAAVATAAIAVTATPTSATHYNDCGEGESPKHWYDASVNLCINWPMDCFWCHVE